MPLDFTAIDFETANGSRASACSVGLVKVRDGRVVDKTGWLIRPPAGHDEFAPWNITIHGITADMVAEAAGWADQLDDLLASLEKAPPEAAPGIIKKIVSLGDSAIPHLRRAVEKNEYSFHLIEALEQLTGKEIGLR